MKFFYDLILALTFAICLPFFLRISSHFLPPVLCWGGVIIIASAIYAAIMLKGATIKSGRFSLFVFLIFVGGTLLMLRMPGIIFLLYGAGVVLICRVISFWSGYQGVFLQLLLVGSGIFIAGMIGAMTGSVGLLVWSFFLVVAADSLFDRTLYKSENPNSRSDYDLPRFEFSYRRAEKALEGLLCRR